MKVLVVSHSCIVGRNRTKFVELSKYSDVELRIALPQYFRDDTSPTKKFTKDVGDLLKIYPLHPVLANIPNKSIILHFYLDYKKVQQFNPDIIHIEEEPYSLVSFQVAISNKRAKILFFTEQNIFKQYPPPFCEFEKFVYRKSSCAIAVSERAKNVLINKGYHKKIFIIPHEVDINTFRKIDSNLLRNSLNLTGFVIGYVGRLVQEKGIYMFLKSASLLKSKNINLLIVGSGPLSDVVRTYRNVPICLIENATHSEVAKYLNCMDVLVLPALTTKNWKEQFGRVLIEAMACKVPVIGSSSGEIPNTIGDAGLVFREGDVSDLASKLLLIMENKRLGDELKENGYKRVVQNFSLEKVASKIYGVYKWVMNTKGNPNELNE